MSSRAYPQALLSADNDMPLVLGAKASVIRCLARPGEVTIPRRLDGEIQADEILVCRDGTISGTTIATEVTFEGEALNAMISADKVVLHDGSMVPGAIWHKELVLEAGHLFEGESRPHDDPKGLAPAPPRSSEAEVPFDKEDGDGIASA